MEIQEKQIIVQYYAIFREQSGKKEESIKTLADTPIELYCELAEKYKFTLSEDLVRFAINDHYHNADTELKDGDCLLLIAPVAGG